MLQIYGKLVSSYILFYLLCQDALIKLASIFVIVFQFEPAHGIRHTVFGTRYSAHGIRHTVFGIRFTAKLTARGIILSSSWHVTYLWNFDLYQ